MPPQLLIALSVAFGVATVLVVVLNQRNSPLLARVRSWPAPIWNRIGVSTLRCGGLHESIPLTLLGVSGAWLIVLGLP
jgi:hypothetical protein